MGSRTPYAVVLSSALLSATPLHAAVVEVFTSDLATVAPTATGFSYTVGGWNDGGTLAGTFEGSDLNSDGQISSLDGEITSFTLSYSGGTVVPPLSFDSAFNPFFDIVYDLDAGPLGDGTAGSAAEGIAALGLFGIPFFFLLYGPGPTFEICGIGEPCGFLLAEIAEPATLGLALGSLGLLGWLRRRYPSVHSTPSV